MECARTNEEKEKYILKKAVENAEKKNRYETNEEQQSECHYKICRRIHS